MGDAGIPITTLPWKGTARIPVSAVPSVVGGDPAAQGIERHHRRAEIRDPAWPAAKDLLESDLESGARCPPAKLVFGG